MYDYSIQNNCKRQKLSMWILMEEIEPVPAEKHEFETRDESIIMTLFGIFDQS